MSNYKHILYISHALAGEQSGLQQAVSQSREHHASLRFIIVQPELPASFDAVRDEFEQLVLEKFIENYKRVCESLDERPTSVHPEIYTQSALRHDIADFVIEHNIDLVMKEIEPAKDMSRFKAFDFDILRLANVPVWLCKPIQKHRDQIEVAVAVDPQDMDDEAKTLSLNLLKEADQIAMQCQGHLHVIGCWHFPFEQAFIDNSFVSYTAENIREQMMDIEDNSYHQLNAMIDEANLQSDMTVHHVDGYAVEEIPELVSELDIDILVMGTIARKGLAGFVMGNTAENIMQQVDCSLLTVKPE